MFIQQKVIIAKMRTAHVPVKVFGLHLQAKDIRQQGGESVGDLLYRLGRNVGVLGVS
jgi:hypothetical protein